MRVYDVIETMTSDAPPSRYDVDDIVDAGQRIARRRRVGRLAAGTAGLAAVAAAVAIVVPFAVNRAKDGGAGATPAGPVGSSTTQAPVFTPGERPFTYTFKGYEVTGYRVGDPVAVTTAYQIAPIAATGGQATRSVEPTPPGSKPPGLQTSSAARGPAMYLVLYRPGAFDPDGLTGAQRLTVAGRPALYKTGMDPAGRHNRFAWQYAADAWAAVEVFSDRPSDVPTNDLQAIAAGLTPAPHRGARIPFTMTYVPAGFKPVSVAMHAIGNTGPTAGNEDKELATVVFARSDLPTTGLVRPWDERDVIVKSAADDGVIPGSFVIFMTADGKNNKYLGSGETPPSTPRCYANGFCNRWSPDGTVVAQVVGSAAGLSNGEMTKILEGIRFSAIGTIHDDATWADASTAFPVGP